MAMTRSGERNVIGVYPDLGGAQKAVTALERAGFDGDDIHLLGEGIERADRKVDVSERDGSVATKVGQWSIGGMLVGAVIGAALGLVVALLVSSDSAWIFVIAGAVIGFNAGMAIGGYARLRSEDNWELTFEANVPGEAAVAVRSADGATLDAAADTLRNAGATRVELA